MFQSWIDNVINLLLKIDYNFIIDIAQVISGVATAVALFFLYKTLRHERDRHQTQLTYDILKI